MALLALAAGGRQCWRCSTVCHFVRSAASRFPLWGRPRPIRAIDIRRLQCSSMSRWRANELRVIHCNMMGIGAGIGGHLMRRQHWMCRRRAAVQIGGKAGGGGAAAALIIFVSPSCGTLCRTRNQSLPLLNASATLPHCRRRQLPCSKSCLPRQ